MIAAKPETTPRPVTGVCPNEYWKEFGGHCYYFSNTWDKHTYESAQRHCQIEAGLSYEAYLTSIHSQAENKFIRDNIVGGGGTTHDVWIGLSRSGSSKPH